MTGQAGATGGVEIEVTPEMIEAVVYALCDYDPELEPVSEAAARIIRDLLKAM